MYLSSYSVHLLHVSLYRVHRSVHLLYRLYRPSCPPGELINLATYCERIRRRFWPEWFVDLEDLCYRGDTDDSDTDLPDLGLYSRTDTFQDDTHTHMHTPPTHTHTPTPAHTHSHGLRSRAHTPAPLLAPFLAPPPELHSPDSDRTGHSLYDSDMDTECSEMEPLK